MAKANAIAPRRPTGNGMGISSIIHHQHKLHTFRYKAHPKNLREMTKYEININMSKYIQIVIELVFY
jgi:hypothetical protein